MDNSLLLILLTFLPIVGMVGILALPKGAVSTIRWVSLGIVAAQMVIAFLLWGAFNSHLGGINDPKSFQFVTQATWLDLPSTVLGNIHIDFYMGVDGLSMPMLLLTTIVMLIATASSWTINKNHKGYFALLLLLNVGVMGTFVSLDFFLFYVFWELMLLPMYFLIGIWGGPRREYAAMKFFLYTLAGSVFMLLSIIGLYYSSNVTPGGHAVTHTFNMLSLMNPANYIPGALLSPSAAKNAIITMKK